MSGFNSTGAFGFSGSNITCCGCGVGGEIIVVGAGLCSSLRCGASNNAGGYGVAISANDTNDTLEITVTGKVGETLRWVAHINGVEVAYGL